MSALRAHNEYFHRMTASPPPGNADGEADLVARAREGDLPAFGQLYRKTHGRVLAICLRMTGDRGRATELAHDAFVRAWEQLGSFRGDAAFSTWMHRLTVNVVLAEARAERRRGAWFTADEEVDEESTPMASMPTDVLSQIDLERAIARLPRHARLVFVLHDVEGYRHEEIALQMDLAPGTVRAHLHRARRLLMRMLAA
jgi:RNA polymerase sigma-70 factor (ECF subfamily)